MRLHLLFLALSMLTGTLWSQRINMPAQYKTSKLLAIDLAVVRGDAPLYVLTGDLVSESIVTTVGVGINYQADFIKKMIWNAGVRMFSVSSDFNLAPMGGDLANLVSRSRFIALPLQLGTYHQFQTIRIEFLAGLEYSRMIAQKEQHISTTRLIVIEEQIVNIKQSLVQKNNVEALVTLLIAAPISAKSSTYLAVGAHHGFTDLDTGTSEQKIGRLEFRMGVRCGL